MGANKLQKKCIDNKAIMSNINIPVGNISTYKGGAISFLEVRIRNIWEGTYGKIRSTM